MPNIGIEEVFKSNDKKKVSLTFRLSEEMKEQIAERAKKLNISIPLFLEQLISIYLQNESDILLIASGKGEAVPVEQSEEK